MRNAMVQIALQDELHLLRKRQIHSAGHCNKHPISRIISLEDVRLYWPAGQCEYHDKLLERNGSAVAEASGLYLLAYMLEGTLLLIFGTVNGK